MRYQDGKNLESFNDHTNDNKESEDNPEQGAIGQEQMEWAKQDIAQASENGANWVVLDYHKPVYSASYHALQDEDVQVTREDFVQLADELGVDVVMQGHDHNLTRTKSLVYTPENFGYGAVEDTKKKLIDGVEHHVNPVGVTYVIPNTSGTKAYDAIYKKVPNTWRKFVPSSTGWVKKSPPTGTVYLILRNSRMTQLISQNRTPIIVNRNTNTLLCRRLLTTPSR